MKNKKYLFVPFLLAILISAFFAVTHVKPATAQCVDPTTGATCTPVPCGQAGGPVCPATQESNDNGDGNQKATSVSAPATATPNPTDEAESAGSEWSGTCKLTDKKCPLVFSNGCTHVGGSWEVESTSETEVTLKCTVPLIIDPTPLPITSAEINPESTPLPLSDNREEWLRNGWTGKCSKHNTSSTFPMSSCINNHLAACKNDQGTASQSTAEDGTVSVLCTGIYTGDVGRPNDGFLGGLLPWLGGGIAGILIGTLLPAIQKVRSAGNTMPQTREHILLARQTQVKPADDGESLHRLFGDSDGDAPPPPPPSKK